MTTESGPEILGAVTLSPGSCAVSEYVPPGGTKIFPLKVPVVVLEAVNGAESTAVAPEKSATAPEGAGVFGLVTLMVSGTAVPCATEMLLPRLELRVVVLG